MKLGLGREPEYDVTDGPRWNKLYGQLSEDTLGGVNTGLGGTQFL